MSDTTIHPDGTLVRVTGASASGDPEYDRGAADIGAERLVCGYAADGTGGDEPNGKPYYLLDIPDRTFGGHDWAYPENVEVVKTAAELAARRPPTAAALAREVASSLHGMWGDGVEVDETDASGDDGVIQAYGRTGDGLRIAFRVTVDQIEETDL